MAEARPAGALLEARVSAVLEPMARAIAGEEGPLHDLRVALRRLRVALPLLARARRRAARVDRHLGALGRVLGAPRDLQVAAGLLGEEVQAGVARAELARALGAELAQGLAQLADAGLALKLGRARRELRAIAASGGRSTPRALARSAAAWGELGAAVARRVARLGDRFAPRGLHRLRRDVRRARYVAEVSLALGGDRTEAEVAALRGAQERLGALHDAHVLALWLEARAEAPGASPAVAREARRARDRFVARAEEHHAAFLARDRVAVLAVLERERGA